MKTRQLVGVAVVEIAEERWVDLSEFDHQRRDLRRNLCPGNAHAHGIARGGAGKPANSSAAINVAFVFMGPFQCQFLRRSDLSGSTEF